ncbi:SPRY domain-containing protein [Xylariaceae sp. FL0804]|nr:SPRY domain-containing protein [Xylariaceae sp. FL0804]
MTNPFHHDPPGIFSDSTFTGFLPRIRSSYASALSGSNAGLVRPNSNLHHLLNPTLDSADPTSDLYSTQPLTRSHSTDMAAPYSSSEDVPLPMDYHTTPLPSISRAFESKSFRASTAGGSGFFTPSYLRGSSYIKKLEQAHKAKQTQQEAQQPPGGGSQAGSTAGSLSSKPPSSHLGMTYDLIERIPAPEQYATVAPLPTRWNNDDKTGALDISSDGLDVAINVANKHSRDLDHEVCGVRSNHAMPVQAGIYYFEVTLLSKRRDETTVCVGFATKAASLSRPPGWEPDTWGYHGDDGDIYSGANTGKRYKEKFGPGDVVGCGVNFRTGQVFFTKNGNSQGLAFRDVKEKKLYPSIGVKKPGEHIRVNFGQTPFIFDIDHVMREEQASIKTAISNTSFERLVSPPMNETELVQQLVLQFLQHDGYVETARAFAEELHAEKQALSIDATQPTAGINIKDDEDAHRRQRIRRAILEGDIDNALELTSEHYPKVLNKHGHVYFKLKCRKFIEMVRKSAESSNAGGKKSNGHSYDEYIPNEMDLDENGFSDKMEEDMSDLQQGGGDLTIETIAYGQALQAEFKDDPRREVAKTLEDVFALLAYPNPLQVQEIAPLLDRKGRTAVAEELNSTILSSLGKSSRSALENLYGQTSVLLDYLREDGGPGTLVTIQSIIDDIPKSQPY